MRAGPLSVRLPGAAVGLRGVTGARDPHGPATLPQLPTVTSMDTSALLAGAVSGAIFVGAAYATSRYTRRILVAGLIVAALVYVYFAADARTGAGWLAAELLGVAVYGGVALRGLRGSAWWIAAGWALHPVWDVALHFAGPGRAFAPAWYTVSCLTWDLVVAAVVAYRAVRGSRAALTPALRTPAPVARRGWAEE